MIDALAVALLVVAVGSLLFRDLAAGITGLTLQGAVLGAIGLFVALESGQPHGWIAVGLTLTVKVVAVPYALRRALARVPVTREVDSVLPDRVLLLLGVGVALLGDYGAAPLSRATATGGRALALAVGLMLVGLLMTVVRRKTLSQVYGLVTLENGTHLAALVAMGGLPFAVELAIAVDVLIAAIVMAILTAYVSISIQSTDTTRMRVLHDAPGGWPPSTRPRGR
jgi:hydrogenase-4 membrane subunit HyfE